MIPLQAGEVNPNGQATNPNHPTTHTDQPAAEQPCDQPGVYNEYSMYKMLCEKAPNRWISILCFILYLFYVRNVHRK